MYRNFSFMALIICILSACVSATSVSLPTTSNSTGLSYQFVDKRPEKQKITYVTVDSSGKNVYFGDGRVNPTGSKLLQEALQKKLNVALTGKEVVLTDFLVIVSDPTFTIDTNRIEDAAANLPNATAATTSMATAVIYGIESGKKNVYVRITGNVEGKEFSKHNSKTFWWGASEANIKTIINKTLEETVTQIEDIITN